MTLKSVKKKLYVEAKDYAMIIVRSGGNEPPLLS